MVALSREREGLNRIAGRTAAGVKAFLKPAFGVGLSRLAGLGVYFLVIESSFRFGGFRSTYWRHRCEEAQVGAIPTLTTPALQIICREMNTR